MHATHGPQKGLCSHACVPRNKRRAIHNWENPSNLPPCGVTCATHPGPRSTRDIRVHRGVGVNTSVRISVLVNGVHPTLIVGSTPMGSMGHVPCPMGFRLGLQIRSGLQRGTHLIGDEMPRREGTPTYVRELSVPEHTRRLTSSRSQFCPQAFERSTRRTCARGPQCPPRLPTQR